MHITLCDIILLAITFLGVWEGKKKGFYKMITPFIAFIISIILMKWVSMFIMNIFGDALIEFFSSRLDIAIAQIDFTDTKMIEDLKYDFVNKFVQGCVFALSYAALNIVVTIFLNKVCRISNNMVLHRIDQILGGIVGAMANVFTGMLVITIIQVLVDMNITEAINILNYMRQSVFLGWLIDNNYIYKLFSLL